MIIMHFSPLDYRITMKKYFAHVYQESKYESEENNTC